MSANQKNKLKIDKEESKKRQREWFLVIALGILFFVLTWGVYKLFGISQSLPFVHSIFFFGLVNFNIILFLILTFLIFRNIVKNFSEREENFAGKTLKSKLITAFVSFSFIPTTLMFLVSVFYINNSFDKWFSQKMSGILKSAIDVTNEYYSSAKKENYHFAEQISKNIQVGTSSEKLKKQLKEQRKKYRLDVLEYYPSLLDDPLVAYGDEKNIPKVPPASLEFLKKGIIQKAESSTIHQFGEGNLVRVIVPVEREGQIGAVVVSSYIPMSLIAKMDDIALAFEEFQNTDPLAYPLKSIYLIILFLMTLVILLGATWFGFYLARQLSIPLEELGQATQRVAKGDYKKVDLVAGAPEINRLISNFNIMTKNLESSELAKFEANQNLRKTLGQLDEQLNYIEVVLKNVSAGVITINQNEVVTMVNRYASELLKVDAEQIIGKNFKESLSHEFLSHFKELVDVIQPKTTPALTKEAQIQIGDESKLLQLTVTLLTDAKGQELGKVLVFDDLSLMLNAQRAAAWTEVARRIAHEIKNPLTPISLAAQRLQKKFGSSIEDEAFSNCTKMIIQQVDDLKSLVNEFSQFARLPRANPVVGSLNQTIKEALLLFDSLDHKSTLEFESDDHVPLFKFDRDQIKRIVNNLVDNALSGVAKVKNGQVTVKTLYNSELRIVQIVVEDNGVGVPNYMRDRIFEPYITTKRDGTGLGLAIVKRMVEDHNGYIRAQVNKPSGMRIVIELPVVPTEKLVTQVGSVTGIKSTSEETI